MSGSGGKSFGATRCVCPERQMWLLEPQMCVRRKSLGRDSSRRKCVFCRGGQKDACSRIGDSTKGVGIYHYQCEL